MSKGIRHIAVAGLCAVAALLLAGEAQAFFPTGGFNDQNQLRYAVWPYNDFDTNNNGSIEQGEGLEIRIEGGSRGFTPDEIELVKQGLKVWEDVPTSYVRFRTVGPIEDPILPGTSSPDYLPTIFMQVTETGGQGNIVADDPEFIVTEVGSLAGLTLTLYTITDVPVTSGSSTVIVPAGNILDSDIIINATYHRSSGAIAGLGAIDLVGSIVVTSGMMLGMGHTPLNNIDSVDETNALAIPVETTALQLTGPDGVARMVGATPSMLNMFFLTELPEGTKVMGHRDLAPDDISGISFLYPLKDGQERFFDLRHEARTHTRRGTGIPSSPVSGAHIVAWANVSNNEGGQRIPLFSSMSGLYEIYTNKNLVGWFDLLGLWKQMEIPSTAGQLFQPSYVITMNPLTGGGYDRQAPNGLTAAEFDTIQGALPFSYTVSARPATEFATNYPSEVFNEFGNVYGIENAQVGTPLAWDFTKNTVVSVTSGKTLPTILPLNRPMFGDPNDVCPLNVIEGAGGVDTGNIDTGTVTLGVKKLRQFRDDWLLRSAVGMAAVDAWYHVAPMLARGLVQSQAALDVSRRVLVALVWVMEHVMVLLTAGLVLCCGMIVWRLRRRARAVAALLLVVAFLAAMPAMAQQIPFKTSAMVANATDVLEGKVTAVQARWSPPTTTPPSLRIYTDVTLEVNETAKGDQNKASTVTFSVIGGELDGFAMTASGIPTFKLGEEVVLYMVKHEGRGLVLYAGEQGKQVVRTSTETGEKVVEAGSVAGEIALKSDKKSIENSDDAGKTEIKTKENPEAATTVPLTDYMDYLRQLARDQAKSAR